MTNYKKYNLIDILCWNAVVVSFFWLMEFAYFLMVKIISPEHYFHSEHFPVLIIIFAVLFTIFSIILGLLLKIFKRGGQKSNKRQYYFTVSTAIILLLYLLGFFNFRIGINGLDINYYTLKHIDFKIIIGNILIITAIFISLKPISLLTRLLLNKIKYIKTAALATVVFCFILHWAITSIDPNRCFMPKFVAAENLNTPNIIVAVIDNLRADYLECYGCEAGLTTNIDRIAQESSVFLNTFATSPWTAPSFGSIYTSLCSYKLFYTIDRPEISQGIEGRYFYHPVNKLRQETPSITSLFKDKGYIVATFQANYQAGHKFNFQLHNDFFLSCYNQTRNANLFFVVFRVIEQGFISFLNLPREAQSPLSALSQIKYCAKGKNLTDYVTAFLKKNGANPFLLIVNYMDVHEYDKRIPEIENQSIVEALFSKEGNQHQYAVNTVYCDKQIGRLYEFLSGEGLLDNTILVIISDHGEQFGEHGWLGEHGMAVYNEEIKVPFIIRYPEKIPAGKRYYHYVSLLDVLPTILEICEFETEQFKFDGINAFDTLSIGRKLYAGHTLYTEDKYAVITNPRKLIYDSHKDLYEMYNLNDDNGEQNALDPDSVESGIALKHNLIAWRADMEEFQQEILEDYNQSNENQQLEKEDLRSIGYVK